MRILKERVVESIGVHQLLGTSGFYLRATIVLTWYLLSFTGLFFSTNPFYLILLCISLGFATAAVGFNIFHDAIHGTFSHRRWINHVWAFLSCSLIGPSHFIWRYKHNYLHHQFPNIQGWDDDLETRGGLRLSPLQPWSARYRFQHIYAPAVYSLTTIEWVFFRDFIRYFRGEMNESRPLPRMTISDHFEFWISKFIYVFLTVILPLSVFPIRTYLIGFFIVHISASIILAVIFQLAHVVLDSEFPVPDLNTGKLDLDWVRLQLATTVNFAPTSKLLSWYCGGLNFQIEHHLLPGVCHAHYKKISPVVEATVKEFGYPYHSIPTHLEALQNHLGMLKRLSLKP